MQVSEIDIGAGRAMFYLMSEGWMNKINKISMFYAKL